MTKASEDKAQQGEEAEVQFSTSQKNRRIQTAEGWKRSMIKERKQEKERAKTAD